MIATLDAHRWSMAPLLEVSGLSIDELGPRLGVHKASIIAAAVDGLTDVQADHWAVWLGWHPMSVWGWDWIVLADQAGPTHVRLAAVLRNRIEGGAFAPGEQLPTREALAEQFDVSRTTVSRALADLRDEGLLCRERGRQRTIQGVRRQRAKAS